jgi:DUSAM domain-containing protein
MLEEIDWDPIRDLARRVLVRGESLELNEATKELLFKSAREVALRQRETENALLDKLAATELLREISRRIAEGSDRIGDALLRMYEIQDRGDIEGARQQMRDVLAVECVPLYREIAEGELEKLDDY